MTKRQQRKMVGLVGKWSNANIIKALRESSNNGVVSSAMATQYHQSLGTMARRRFGSFSNACTVAGIKSANDAKERYTVCTVKECGLLVRSTGSPYCEKHYGRIRRNGNTSKRIPPIRISHSQGYLLRYAPGHALLTRDIGNYVYEHRFVYFESNGYGPFKCYLCHKDISWDNLHIDHLNNIKTDNNIKNLKPSCPKCNQARGHEKMRKTWRLKGKRLTHNGLTMCQSEWARKIGISNASLLYRLNNGWPLDKALTQPRGVTGPR